MYIDQPQLINLNENIARKLNDNTTLLSIYKHPKYSLTENAFHTILRVRNRVVVVGDFNAKHPQWNNRTNPNENMTYRCLMGDTCDDVFLYYLNESTFYSYNGDQPSTLDVLVTKGDLQPSDLTVAHDMASNHSQ